MDLLDAGYLSKGIATLGAAVVGLVTWSWNKLDGRVTRLEETAATQKQFEDLRDDVRGLYGKVESMRDDVIKALSQR